MNDGVSIKLVGDGELLAALRALDYATQQRELKKILREAGTKTIVKHLKSIAPFGGTGKLRDSMGVVMGKARSKAVVFVGPRMSHKRNEQGDRREGYQGWVANILEFAKDKDRKPLKAKAFRPFSGGPAGPEFFKKVGPIKKKTHFVHGILSQLKPAEVYITTATRTVLERTWNRNIKKTGAAGYAAAKGR